MQPLEPEVFLRATPSSTGRGAADRTIRRRARSSARARTPRRRAPPSPRPRAPAARSARSSSASRRRRPETLKPPSVRRRRQPAGLRLRAVDEEVGELVSPRSSGSGSGTSVKSRRRNSSIPSPVAHESAKDRDQSARSSIEKAGLGREVDLVQHDDLRQLVDAGAVRAELGVDRPPLLVDRLDASITWTSVRARSRCARNSWPRPMPSLAPSISPGTSATTSCRPSGASTVPSTGCSVVNGYSATFGRAFEMRVSSDDLPAFGRPTSAASASSLSAARRRARRPEARPRRTAAPGAWTRRSARCRGRRGRRGEHDARAGCARSAISRRPRRTPASRRAPAARVVAVGACLRAPRPFWPRRRLDPLAPLSAERSRSDGSATSTTSPPSPPSPPSGPPFGTNFSRRK